MMKSINNLKNNRKLISNNNKLKNKLTNSQFNTGKIYSISNQMNIMIIKIMMNLATNLKPE